MTLGLDPREQTLGDVLHAAGYRCGMVGKWDMGQARRYLPLQRGFDFFYGHGNNGIDYYTHERYGVHSHVSPATSGPRPTRAPTPPICSSAKPLRFIRDDTNPTRSEGLSPGSSTSASTPRTAPRALAPDAETNPQVARRRASAGRLRRQVCRHEAARTTCKRYYAAVTCMDAAIGEIARADSRARRRATTRWSFSSPTTAAAATAATRRSAGKRARSGKAASASPSSPAGPAKFPPAASATNSSPRSSCCPRSPPPPARQHRPRRDARRLRHAARARRRAALAAHGNVLGIPRPKSGPRRQLQVDRIRAGPGAVRLVAATSARNTISPPSMPDIAADISARWTAWRETDGPSRTPRPVSGLLTLNFAYLCELAHNAR